jgi:hypothetical protein
MSENRYELRGTSIYDNYYGITYGLDEVSGLLQQIDNDYKGLQISENKLHKSCDLLEDQISVDYHRIKLLEENLKILEAELKFMKQKPSIRQMGSTLAMYVSAIIWIFGIVIAKGFWSTFFAVIFPFWSFYLVAEEIFLRYLS